MCSYSMQRGESALPQSRYEPEQQLGSDDLTPEFREWIIEFGQNAHVVRYHFDGRQAVILAVRYGREAGY